MELSIVVPVLNEAEELPALLMTLQHQQDVDFELILSDGGSKDGTTERAEELAGRFRHPLKLVRGSAGRGCQLNRGAAAAGGEILLFLHVDSRFVGNMDLRRSLDALQKEQALCRGTPVAGHFRLRFADAPESLLSAMTYWEIKARLHRFGCNHGDQGLMMARSDFERLGRYPELPLFEDTLMAEKLKKQGRLTLLPVELYTSARRFATEGLRQRHTLNAILMTCHQVGLDEFFLQARGHYRQQQESGRLAMTPFLQALDRVLDDLPGPRRRRIWLQAAAFVRTQAWQLLLARRIKRGIWCLETDPGTIEAALDRFDRIYDRLTDNRLGHFLALVLLHLWLARQKRVWRRLDRARASH
ncbi:MAG: TIGR04283 family arsenosugar biosynthesis glycosyltransferase [Geothermobacteraceae bacterium]